MYLERWAYGCRARGKRVYGVCSGCEDLWRTGGGRRALGVTVNLTGSAASFADVANVAEVGGGVAVAIGESFRQMGC